MPGGDKAQVLIELQLEMKKMKGQMKEFMSLIGASQKKIVEAGKSQKEAGKDSEKAVDSTTKAYKRAADAVERAEKKKKAAIERTSKALEAQEKKIGSMTKAWNKIKSSSTGQFGAGIMAGAGLGGLTQQVSARGAGGVVGRGISGAIGGIGNFFVSGVTNAYQKYMQYGQAQGGLVGLGSSGGMRADRRLAGASGASLGYSAIQTAQQARGIGRATGNIGAVYGAQQVSRAYGMDVGEAGGYMGMLRQAGYGFGGQVRGPGGGMQRVDRTGTREFTKIIEAGMISGLEKGRIGEFLQGVSSITSNLGSQLPGKINTSGIAAQAAMLGQSKLPGFQGARGMQLLARLNQSIQRPGGGESGQAMMLQALGFGKPGGQTGYYEALKTQEEGINDPRNLPKLMKEVYSQLGDPARGGRSSVNQEANLAMKEMTGLSLKQVEELQDIIASGEDAATQQEKIKELMEKAEPIEKQSLKEMQKGFGGVIKHIAGVEDTQIGIGSKFAGFFMQLQHLQLKALKALAEYLPKIVHWLKEQYMSLSGLAEWGMKQIFGDEAGDFNKMVARQAQKLEKAGIITGEEESIAGRKRKLIMQIAAYDDIKKELESKRGKKGLFGKALSIATGNFDLDTDINDTRYGNIVEQRKRAADQLRRERLAQRTIGATDGSKVTPAHRALVAALRKGGDPNALRRYRKEVNRGTTKALTQDEELSNIGKKASRDFSLTIRAEKGAGVRQGAPGKKKKK